MLFFNCIYCVSKKKHCTYLIKGRPKNLKQEILGILEAVRLEFKKNSAHIMVILIVLAFFSQLGPGWTLGGGRVHPGQPQVHQRTEMHNQAHTHTHLQIKETS